MTNREESPVTPLAVDQQTNWADADIEPHEHVNSNNSKRKAAPSNDVENDKSSTPDLTNENWRSLLDDPDQAVSKLIPYLESFALQNGKLKREVEEMQGKLRESKSMHRNSVHTVHKNMLQKLLATEQEHEDDIEETARKMSELERKVQTYEEIDRGGDINKSLQTFFAQEKQNLEKIQKLEKANKDLEEELKIEKMKMEADEESGRRSVTTLQDQILKRMVKVEEENEKMIHNLKQRNEVLERELQRERVKTQEMDKSRRESISTLHANMNRDLIEARVQHEDAKKDYSSQIKELKLQVKYLELQNSTLRQDPRNSQDKEVERLQEELKRSQEELQKARNGGINGGELNSLREKVRILEDEKKTVVKQLHAEEHKRKSSNAELSASMFQRQMLVEQERESEKIQYERQIRELQKQLEEITSGGTRRASEIHSSMFTSLLEAEAEFTNAQKEWDRKESKLKLDVQHLTADKNSNQNEIATLKQHIHHLENSKLQMIDQCNQQINFLRTSIRVMSHK